MINKKNLGSYEIDASRTRGKALDVFHPKTISEVKSLVAKSKRIVVRGAGSGLAGGCVPQNGLDIVLDLSKLNSIGTFDKERKTIEVEAGVVLGKLQDYLEEFNLEFPVNPSSHDIATIGGMISTNAVGDRAIKYGKTGQWIRWIEVIDSKGNLSRKGTTEISDYIGLEGITGVIVKACLNLIPLKKRTVTLKKANTLEEVVELVNNFKKNQDISMIEFLDKQVSLIVGLEEKYHLIVEYENESGELSNEKYEDLLKKRDMVYPHLARLGFVRIEDPKILLNKFISLMTFLEENNIPTFGHIGVGILHPCFNKESEHLIPELMKLIKKLGGQVSGEHGIGILKKQYVDFNDKKILLNIKKRLDPENKFNNGKVI